MHITLPRPEYPRPDFERPEWMNLDGQWDFEFDDENIGEKGHCIPIRYFQKNPGAVLFSK